MSRPVSRPVSPPVGLVVAKAPVPGRVKTRLAAAVGPDAAARLAAAALLDTLDACEAAFGADRCFLALAGDLADGVDCVEGERVADRVARWTVLPQRGDGLAARLAHAHQDVARLLGSRARSAYGDGDPTRPGRGGAGPLRTAAVVQVGMDTPQVTAADLAAVAAALWDGADAVLGPACDGGWWVLGLTRAEDAGALRDVAMSTARTHHDTRAALVRSGAAVADGAPLRDVDDVDDAVDVATRFPGTRFARCWAQVAGARR